MKWVRAVTTPPAVVDAQSELVVGLDVEFGTSVTIIPTSDVEEMMRLLGRLSASAATDDDGRCWFCAHLAGYDDADEHAPGCDLVKAREFLATQPPQGEGK